MNDQQRHYEQMRDRCMAANDRAVRDERKTERNETMNIEKIFTYHKPTPEQLPRYDALRAAARAFAQVILDNTPACADRSAAIRKVREAVMTANACIALDGDV